MEQTITAVKCTNSSEWLKVRKKLAGQGKRSITGQALAEQVQSEMDWSKGFRYILSYSNSARVQLAKDPSSLERIGCRAKLVLAQDFLSH